MRYELNQDLSKAIGKAVKQAIDEGLSTFGQNAAGIAAVRRMYPDLGSDSALALVLKWRKSK